MDQRHGGDRPFPTLHNVLKMILSTNPASKAGSVHEDKDQPEDIDEPPDHHHHPHHNLLRRTSATHAEDGLVYIKSPNVLSDRKESLLTRALKSSPEMTPSESHAPDHPFAYRSYPHSNVSGVSTAELTSDGGLTSPSLSNTPSPPLPSHMTGRSSRIAWKMPAPVTSQPADAAPVPESSESKVEANLGRKRCISFACGRKAAAAANEQKSADKSDAPSAVAKPSPAEQPPQRKTALTFACPTRQREAAAAAATGAATRTSIAKTSTRCKLRGSPAPTARKPLQSIGEAASSDQKTPPANPAARGIPTSGLGKFEASEATRFHEFASSVEEDEDWVAKPVDYPEKITMTDCMLKEIAIRKLGEEAEEEALQDEEAGDAILDAEDVEDVADDDSTVHDFSDDGNESDNEAGFAESDDSDDGSEYEFWAPSTTTAATTPPVIDALRQTLERRDSHTSMDSFHEEDEDGPKWLPAPPRKGHGRRPKGLKMRPRTPSLPDSTDFVCGTLDEDRPLEAAYKSCLEQRRRSKQIVIPQDIDPSFPTTDPEDQEDADEFSTEDVEATQALQKQLASYGDEELRGRPSGNSGKTSPRHSPKRMVSPPPPTRKPGRSSPKRLKSPPPPKPLNACTLRLRSPLPPADCSTGIDGCCDGPQPQGQGLTIAGVTHRPVVTRTKSLPRTPNPFFTTLDRSRSHRWAGFGPVPEAPEREPSRTREAHTRGPIDIVEGLEQKRQRRKEKYWRQHCRRAAKEQMERRPVPGKGAERMKELGLEVAERLRAYGETQDDAQLVLSV